MKIKQILSAFMMLLTVTVILFAVTSCKLTHKHVFSDWENATEPTCTSFGLKKRACECGQAEYETVAALSHTPVTDEAVEATCTASGKTEGSHCSDCGAVITKQTETDKLEHGFSDWETVTEPTCTSFGLKKRACECGQVEYDTFDALSHTVVVDAAIAATCTEPGKTEGSHCGTCGRIITVQNFVVPTGHLCNDITVSQEALCDSDGTKRFSCTNSGCSYYYEESYSLSALDSSAIYSEAVKYTGVIQCYDELGFLIEEQSAFVISADGKIVTGKLAIDDAFSFVFLLQDTYYDVTEVLAFSDESKIAVLKIDATDLPYANLCTSNVSDGEPVYIVGTPSGIRLTLLSGIVSNASANIENAEYIQHDVEAKSGCVGSPLINRFGEVVGINIGYAGDDRLGVAAAVSKIDSLDYSNPISPNEYGNLTYTPAEELGDWITNNYEEIVNGANVYVVKGNDFYHSLGYDTVSEYSFVDGYWKIDENRQLYVRIILNNSDGTYEYYASLKNGSIANEAYGFIDAKTYSESVILTYDTFYGRYWSESELMELYSSAVYDTVGFFAYCLDTYFLDLTLETFGFTSVSYDRDETALKKLQDFVVSNGTHESFIDSYVLSGEAKKDEDLVQFNISYHVGTGDTVLSVHYILADGDKYSVYLTLNATESGNRFDFVYYTFNGEEYEMQNVAWGYLDAGSFTVTTKLVCYEFDGLNEYEDALLDDYTAFLGYVMKLLNEKVMPSVSPELSVKDLGFYYYFS